MLKPFLDYQMPFVMQRLKYRIIDVDSLIELSNRWYPNTLQDTIPTWNNNIFTSKLDSQSILRQSVLNFKLLRNIMFKLK